MKKYLVIGNPIDHSLSPKLHNYWIRQNNLDAIYEKKKIEDGQIQETISSLRNSDGLVVGSQLCKVITDSIKRRQNPVTKLDKLVYSLKNKIL